MAKKLSLFSLFIFFAVSLQAQVPEWIWHPNDGAAPTNNEVRFFRKIFDLSQAPKKAVLAAAGDDELDVWINGEKILSVKGWTEAKYADVTKKLTRGQNLIAIRGRNDTSDAAVLAQLEINLSGRKKQMVVTDSSWKTTSLEETNWTAQSFVAGPNWIAATEPIHKKIKVSTAMHK